MCDFYCNCIGCKGHLQKFIPVIEKQWWGSREVFYDEKSFLQEILRCFVRQNRLICGFCENCFTCSNLNDIRKKLDGVYFFTKRKDCRYQPCCWKVTFLDIVDKSNFYIEIFETRKEYV